MAVCTAIELVEAIDINTSILRVTIDDKVKALMLMDYAEAMKFLDQDVIYTLRKDMYKQEVMDFIATLTRPVAVNTFEKDSSVKLYCDAADSNSNVSFLDIAEGTVANNAVVFCVEQKYESSDKAFWCNLTILDRNRHTAHIRLFDPDRTNTQFAGIYVKCDLRKTKYGFTATFIQPMEGGFPINPEVDIAERAVRDAFASDAKISAFIENSKLFEFMRSYVDYEPGYIAVRTAMELALATELSNLVEHLDLQLIKQTILFSKCFVFAPESKFSRTVINVTKVSHYKFDKQQETLLMLDAASEHVTKEKVVYDSIVETVNTIIKTKKERWSYHR
jgi:hypothetical protein